MRFKSSKGKSKPNGRTVNGHAADDPGTNGASRSNEHSNAVEVAGSPSVAGKFERPTLITGGAGFIGTNLAHRLLSDGKPVLIYDNLSRPGVEKNLAWLQQTHGELVRFRHGDVRNGDQLRKLVREATQVFHFAAQVAVTTSLEDPIDDFETNARGTLNVLEAIRALDNPPPLIFTSTNKVYGRLNDVPLISNDDRYEPETLAIGDHGFDENRSIHFHSPYGCSKGAAEQYVLDYSQTYGLRTAVFRMSCIYGLHQFGNEDQGWVAHFLIRALNGEPITIYGDGRQVRDVLFVEDLIEAFLLAKKNIGAISGQVFNIGGGPANTTSLLELLKLISELRGQAPEVRFDAWRPADQQYYVSDTRKFSEATGWQPAVGVREGVGRLYHWLEENVPARNALNAHAGPNGQSAHRRNGAIRLARSRNGKTPRLKRLFRLNGESEKHLETHFAKAI